MKGTIIIIHGMFQTPKSWENWTAYFTERGFNCVAPAWPLHAGEPAQLRNNPPAGLGELTLNDITEAMQELVAQQQEKPVVIGHSAGGLVVQVLANRQMIKAGVIMDSVAPNAMLGFDWNFFKNTTRIVNPLKGNKPFFIDPESFHTFFANTMTREESDEAFNNFATHDSRNILRTAVAEAGHIDLSIPHVPLLFIGGEKDQVIPASLTEKNAKAYTDANSVADFKEFTNRGHFIYREPGWEEVACFVDNWLERYAASPNTKF